MRRIDREVTEPSALQGILGQCKVCRLAVVDEKGPYIVPMNFGYEYEDGRLTLYLHSAREGRKVRAFEKSPLVAVEMDCAHRLIEEPQPCQYGYAYQSITGSGRIFLVEDTNGKKKALSLLMKHQTGRDFTFEDAMVQAVLVYRVELSEFSGKQRL